MNNHPKLTPEQYAQIAKSQTNFHISPLEDAIQAGKVTRHSPAHNFPVGMSFAEMNAEMEDKLRPMIKEVKQLKFTVASLNAMVTEQRSAIHDLMDRLAKLEAKEFNRNLPSNKRKVEE